LILIPKTLYAGHSNHIFIIIHTQHVL